MYIHAPEMQSFSSKYSAQDANYPLHFLYCIIVHKRDAYNTVSGIQLRYRVRDEAVRVKVAKSDTNLCSAAQGQQWTWVETTTRTFRSLSNSATTSLLFIARWPVTTKETVGTLDRSIVLVPTRRTPLSYCCLSVRKPSRGCKRVRSCCAIAANVASKLFSGVSDRRYGTTPLAP